MLVMFISSQNILNFSYNSSHFHNSKLVNCPNHYILTLDCRCFSSGIRMICFRCAHTWKLRNQTFFALFCGDTRLGHASFSPSAMKTEMHQKGFCADQKESHFQRIDNGSETFFDDTLMTQKDLPFITKEDLMSGGSTTLSKRMRTKTRRREGTGPAFVRLRKWNNNSLDAFSL